MTVGFHVDVGLQAVGDVALPVRHLHQMANPLFTHRGRQGDSRSQRDPRDSNRQIVLRHLPHRVILIADDVEAGSGRNREEGEQLA